MIIRQTKRLIIERFKLEDAPFLLELVNSPGWLKYIGDRNIKTIDAAKNYLEQGSLNSYRQNNFGFYIVKKKSDQKAIGTCGLIKRDELQHVDLGFAFLPEFIGQGYGFESSYPMLEHAKIDLELDQLAALTSTDNEASIRLLLKLGFHFEKLIKFGENEEIINLYKVKL